MANGDIVRMRPGCGFESSSRSHRLDEFLIVDAQLPRDLRSPLHAHEQAYFEFAIDGLFEDQYRGRTLAYEKGTVGFDPSDAPHRTFARGAHILRIEVSTNFLDSAGDVRATLCEPMLLMTPQLASICRRLYTEVTSRGAVGAPLIAQGLLMELVGHAARCSASKRGGVAPQWLRQVRERLDAEFAHAPGLTELAVIAGVHRVHLARMFRAYYGSSIGDYLRERQVAHAQRMLAETDHPLNMVALAAGFADQSHFSNVFQRAVGLPPGRFRRLSRPARRESD
jgi:AraC family transcriptional regulator